MCGILVRLGPGPALPILLAGLKRLEYRGYDSSGVLVFNPLTGKFERVRAEGRLENLVAALALQKIEGMVGMAHTRWATHGRPSEQNAHPHIDCTGTIALVHNGTIDNCSELRLVLQDLGHVFTSDTDTEVMAHLFEERVKHWGKTMSFEDIVRLSLQDVQGTLGIAVMYTGEPEKVVLVNRGASSIIIGVGDNAMFASSDAVGFLAHTRRNVVLESGEIATLTQHDYHIRALNGDHIQREPKLISWSMEEARLGDYPNFLMQEIHAGPSALENVLRGHLVEEHGSVKLGGLDTATGVLSRVKRITMLGSGSSQYAAEIGANMFRRWARMPVDVVLSSAFCDVQREMIDEETATIAISQSGETLDTRDALEEAMCQGAQSIGVVNVFDSAIARMAKRGVYTHSGPEISVASTKVFDAQIVALALIALWFGRRHGLSASEGRRIIKALTGLPGKMRRVLAREHRHRIKDIAESYAVHDNMLFLGRGPDWHIALEGALKMKELSYIHAEGCEAAQMKHGVIALISPQCPSVVVATAPSVRAKVISNISEIRARDGKVLAIALEGDKEVAELASETIFVPWAEEELLQPVLVAPVMQLLAGYAAMYRGCDVDHPRNLAKSVTV